MNDIDKKEPLPELTNDQIVSCLSALETLVQHPGLLTRLSEDQLLRLMLASGRLSRPDREAIRQRNKDKNLMMRKAVVSQERQARRATGIRSARQADVFTAPKMIAAPSSHEQDVLELNSPRNCYVCKKEFTRLHFFYDSMCPSCADFNYQKRFQTAPLTGKTALITGARLKIGYHATLMMLRAGADVIALTRFPVDAALRYSKEEDFSVWKDRLTVYGLDLRHTPSVELFADYMERTRDRLDILINNAAQTVRRPPGFYAHLLPNETRDYNDLPEDARQLLKPYQICREHLLDCSSQELTKNSDLPVSWNGKAPGIGLQASARLSQIPYAYDHALDTEQVFPKGKLDADLQQVDLRTTNSWRLRLGEIETAEMLEIQLVNAVAPFVLCNRLIPLMKRDNTGQKHIVNVSAMEGKFLRFKKGERHPHTNMAKAALNMMTHTSASELANHGIYMNAVDTGWVTDEDPAALSARKQEIHDFQPPLDIVDGAARVCDPFFDGILSGKHWCGQFLKDYHPIDW